MGKKNTVDLMLEIAGRINDDLDNNLKEIKTNERNVGRIKMAFAISNFFTSVGKWFKSMVPSFSMFRGKGKDAAPEASVKRRTWVDEAQDDVKKSKEVYTELQVNTPVPTATLRDATNLLADQLKYVQSIGEAGRKPKSPDPSRVPGNRERQDSTYVEL